MHIDLELRNKEMSGQGTLRRNGRMNLHSGQRQKEFVLGKYAELMSSCRVSCVLVFDKCILQQFGRTTIDFDKDALSNGD